MALDVTIVTKKFYILPYLLQLGRGLSKIYRHI
jgi:hypothetical protein